MHTQRPFSRSPRRAPLPAALPASHPRRLPAPPSSSSFQSLLCALTMSHSHDEAAGLLSIGVAASMQQALGSLPPWRGRRTRGRDAAALVPPGCSGVRASFGHAGTRTAAAARIHGSNERHVDLLVPWISPRFDFCFVML